MLWAYPYYSTSGCGVKALKETAVGIRANSSRAKVEEDKNEDRLGHSIRPCAFRVNALKGERPCCEHDRPCPTMKE